MKNPGRDPIRAEYARLSQHYDRRWSFYVDASIDETLRRLPDPGRQVLDLACGTGSLLQVLRRNWPQIELIGLDLSFEMLGVAAGKLGSGAALCQGSAEQLPWRGSVFDLVISTSAFHYFRDPECVLAEIRRVLRPGGHVVITDWCHDYWTCRLLDLFLRWFNPAHHRAYKLAECAGFVHAGGLEPRLLQRYKISRLWGLMTLVAVKAAD